MIKITSVVLIDIDILITIITMLGEHANLFDLLVILLPRILNPSGIKCSYYCEYYQFCAPKEKVG